MVAEERGPVQIPQGMSWLSSQKSTNQISGEWVPARGQLRNEGTICALHRGRFQAGAVIKPPTNDSLAIFVSCNRQSWILSELLESQHSARRQITMGMLDLTPTRQTHTLCLQQHLVNKHLFHISVPRKPLCTRTPLMGNRNFKEDNFFLKCDDHGLYDRFVAQQQLEGHYLLPLPLMKSRSPI
jgi:hypothetical protein